MGDCRYCGKPAGFLRKEHRECAERHASAQHRIRRLCVDAALHGGDLDSLPSRIREAASAASIEICSHELSNLLATGWCGAVEAAMEDLALSAAEKRGLNRYRRRFNLDEGRLDGGGHFQMFRMMALLDSLTTDGVVPRFDGASAAAGFGMLPFNLMKSDALLWVFGAVGYLQQVTRREFRGRSMSVGFRVAKGVYVRPGTFRGRAVESTSMEQRDAGLLGITTKHLYFKGSQTSFRVRMEKIVSFEPFRDGLQIMRDTARAKPEVFTMGTTDVWFAVNLINALVGIEDVALPGRDAPTLDDIVNEVPDEKV